MVAGGRGGRGARPPEYGTTVGCTPAGVPEPLSPCRVTSASGTPPGCSPITRRLPGGRYPFAPERPPATICQPFGLKHRGACFRGDSKVDAHALKRGVNESDITSYLGRQAGKKGKPRQNLRTEEFCLAPNIGGCSSTLPPSRRADIPVRSNARCTPRLGDGLKRAVWRNLLRTGKFARRTQSREPSLNQLAN
jgi:hypothetical protein